MGIVMFRRRPRWNEEQKRIVGFMERFDRKTITLSEPVDEDGPVAELVDEIAQDSAQGIYLCMFNNVSGGKLGTCEGDTKVIALNRPEPELSPRLAVCKYHGYMFFEWGNGKGVINNEMS